MDILSGTSLDILLLQIGCRMTILEPTASHRPRDPALHLAMKRELAAQRITACQKSRERPNDDNRESKSDLHFRILPL